MTALDTFAIQVVELYLSHLTRKFPTRGTAKVVVELRSADELPAPVKEAEVLTVRWPLDFDRLERSDDHGKKWLLLDALHNALVWVAVRCAWTREPLDDAYAASLADDLVFSGWSLPNSVPHPYLACRANCRFEFDGTMAHIFVVITSGAGKDLGSKHAFDTPVGYDLTRRLLGSLEWVGPSADKLKLTPGPSVWGEATTTVDVSDILRPLG
jgi:hypothetical protein